MNEFSNKTVAITGGAKGIGLDLSLAFANVGARAFAISRSCPEGFNDLHENLSFVQADVRNRDSLRTAIQSVQALSDGLDIFVNNAGISNWKTLDKVDENFWQNMMETNVSGCIWGCQAAADAMRASGRGGVIINIASLAGKRGSKNNSVYCATKFAMVGITQALSKELGEYNIRVNSICPVYVATEGLLEALSGDHPEVGDIDPKEFLLDWGERNAALGRLPTGAECASACLWLASDGASAVTGQNINVDCGVLPQ